MRFEPLTPKGQRQGKPPCDHPEHNPPGSVVLEQPARWVCPGCGRSVLVRPSGLRW